MNHAGIVHPAVPALCYLLAQIRSQLMLATHRALKSHCLFAARCVAAIIDRRRLLPRGY